MELGEFKERRELRNSEIRALVDEAQAKCNEFFKEQYRYDDTEAVEELGIDSELVQQLVEEYVKQIVKSTTLFKKYLETLKEQNSKKDLLDFTPFRELVHKNLGVARNLRIKDSEQILKELMTYESLDEIEVYLSILEACAIKLKPLSAYKALQEQES